jgi:hypothetical protein
MKEAIRRTNEEAAATVIAGGGADTGRRVGQE